MQKPADHFFKILLVWMVFFLGITLLQAQTSNRVWFASYNGHPTPSSDVGISSVIAAGSGTTLTTGSAMDFISQTNFSSFNSPYDLAVDPAMGKLYVLDNNLQGAVPECIYSFNLTGTPAQIAASAQVIYTMPVPSADVSAGLYPLLSGVALDPLNHYLYFNQIDVVTATNSYLGRLDLATSSNSDVYVSSNNSPVLHTFYIGRIPGQGALALDSTNIYIGAVSRTGNSGVYAAPLNGSGSFTEWAGISTNDPTFTNGLVSGVACDSADGLIYFLTYNAGDVNFNFKLSQNAVWVYNSSTHSVQKIASGYLGYPGNISVDSANRRYYFTLGRDGTGDSPATNHQAVYTGVLNSTNAPTLFYTPSLSGLDQAGQADAGAVTLQGIYIQDAPSLNLYGSTASYAPLAALTVLAPAMTINDPSSTVLTGATVAIVAGGFSGDGDLLAAATNNTAITANYNATTSTLTLSGADSVFDYEQVLSTVAFSSTNSNPTKNGTNNIRTISWSATDGILNSASVNSTIAIQPAQAPAFNHLVITDYAGTLQLYYTGTPGQKYVIQFAVTLKGPWTDISPVLTASSGGLIQYTDLSASSTGTRFYRVSTTP